MRGNQRIRRARTGCQNCKRKLPLPEANQGDTKLMLLDIL